MPEQLKGLRVLLAEDDFLIAAHVGGILEDHGAEVAVIASVRELLAADPAHYDIAILDNTLLDGEIGDASNRLREAGVPLIHQSGDDVSAKEADGRFAAVLGKPINEAELIAALSDHGMSKRPRPE